MTDHPPRPHVLAINDDPAILELYADLLTAEGYRVTAELLPFVEVGDVLAVEPDLVVLDLLVGQQALGTAFLALLKTDPATERLPVLVCSAAKSHLEKQGDQLRAWACTVITKPFDIDAFLGAVASCLSGHPAPRGDAPGVVTGD